MTATTTTATLALLATLAAPLSVSANASHTPPQQPPARTAATKVSASAHHVAPQVYARREASYRAYYHNKFGAYPSQRQVDEWYARTYGAQGS